VIVNFSGASGSVYEAEQVVPAGIITVSPPTEAVKSACKSWQSAATVRVVPVCAGYVVLTGVGAVGRVWVLAKVVKVDSTPLE